MIFHKTIYALVLSAGSLLSVAQTNPDADIIYNPDVLATIEITMSANDKSFLHDKANIWSETYLPVTMRFVNNELDTTVSGVGIRLRGNTSRNHPKKSYKLDLKEFGGKKFFGYKKFNLKAENNDPTFLREHFSLQTYRNAGITAARSHYAKVYINGEYMGLYLNVEQVDDAFIETRFGNDSGNLYKCGYGSSLTTNGQVNDTIVFELETNKTVNDRSKLLNFVDKLNNTSNDSFASVIQQLVDIEQVTLFFATEVLLGHWDAYIYNQNNFYIYENPVNGKMAFIPYDMDNTFGMDWVGGDWGTRNVLDWGNKGQLRPLFTRIMNVPAFKQKYMDYLQFLVDDIFNTKLLFPQFDDSRILLNDAVKTDTYFPQPFGFDYDDFINGFDQKVVKHAPYGLKPYVETRIQSASKQVPLGVQQLEDEYFMSVYPNPMTGNVLHIQGYSNMEIMVYALDGKPVKFEMTDIMNNSFQIHFPESLNAGLYFVKIGEKVVRFLVL